MNIKGNKYFNSSKILSTVLIISSILISTILYFYFFINMLPRYFNNMESIEKNMLAYLIIVISIYILMKIVFRIDQKVDRYVLVGVYFLVLLLGLLRPDVNYKVDTFVSWNPLGFLSAIRVNEASFYVMIINLIIFMPMYFLLSYSNIFNSFNKRLIFFELFIFIIEFLQFKLHIGVFDLSDIFLYNIGILLSFIFMKFLNLRNNKKENL